MSAAIAARHRAPDPLARRCGVRVRVRNLRSDLLLAEFLKDSLQIIGQILCIIEGAASMRCRSCMCVERLTRFVSDLLSALHARRKIDRLPEPSFLAEQARCGGCGAESAAVTRPPAATAARPASVNEAPGSGCLAAEAGGRRPRRPARALHIDVNK